MRPRKDYGCPLRIYRDPVRGIYTVLPPRSQRAAELYLHAASPQQAPAWQGLLLNGSGESTVDGPTLHQAGPHLGQRIPWGELPAAVQAAVRGSFLGEYCPREVAP